MVAYYSSIWELFYSLLVALYQIWYCYILTMLLYLLVDGGATFDAFYFVKWLINLLRFK